jgi:hypothetical protein
LHYIKFDRGKAERGHLRQNRPTRGTSAHTPIADMATLGATVEEGQEATKCGAAKTDRLTVAEGAATSVWARFCRVGHVQCKNPEADEEDRKISDTSQRLSCAPYPQWALLSTIPRMGPSAYIQPFAIRKG